MAAIDRHKSEGLALLAAPWPLYNRPSIQLGTLRAFLRTKFPGIRVDSHHLYLPLAAAIGYDTYQAVSERTWLAEAVYATLLFPEHFDRIEAFFQRRAGRHQRLKGIRLEKLGADVRSHTDRLLEDVGGRRYAMAGLSVSLCQLSASLYVLRRIKELTPETTCLVGGSTFSGVPPGPVFELVPEIDLIVSGEGELPLLRLVQSHLMEGTPLAALQPERGIYNRYHLRQRAGEGFTQMSSLEQLPTPDYDEYFEQLAALPPERQFFATLPVELSRGCWWRPRRSGRSLTKPAAAASDGPPEGGPRSQRPGHRSALDSGCAFCNLNLQWSGYRQKSAGQATAEIEQLTARHRTLSIAFADNLLPARRSAALFDRVRRLKKDLRLFGEIRATTDPDALARMHAAGMDEVQIGIEALSGSLLGKMGKGTRVIDNLAIMKSCEELGIKNVSNLILIFPGSDAGDVAETLQTLEFALPFRPLKAVDFWLGRGSPLWHFPRQAGIGAVFNHPDWAHLFPRPFARRFPFLVLGYRGDRTRQRRLWQPVRSALKEWERSWHLLRNEPGSGPLLSYRDGREFLIIHQRRAAGPNLTHRLVGSSRRIYLYCRRPRPFAQIREVFGALPEDRIGAFLKMMVGKRLMFEERNRFLSLAVAGNRRACAPQRTASADQRRRHSGRQQNQLR